MSIGGSGGGWFFGSGAGILDCLKSGVCSSNLNDKERRLGWAPRVEFCVWKSLLSRIPRVYLAAELEPFLAPWIRTGLGLMGVGFAVSRFGLFLREFRTSQTHVPVQSTGLSEWSGVGLVALGVLVTLSATVRHLQLVRELSCWNMGAWADFKGRNCASALILALMGLHYGGLFDFCALGMICGDSPPTVMRRN